MGAVREMLFIPSVRKGDGIGHLRRCLDFSQRAPNGALLLPKDDSGERRLREVARASGIDLPEERLIREEESAARRWELVLLDRRTTTVEELDRFRKLGPVAAIDEGGAARPFVPYLLDTLPLPRGASGANIASSCFLTRPINRRPKGAPPTGRVLVSFGGEDPGALSAKTARALIKEGIAPACALTIVVGPLFRPEDYPKGARILVSPPSLRELLHEYDLVVTSFGLTAYESVAAGAEVLIVNPTRYHRRLAKIAGFPDVGLGSPNRRRLRRASADHERQKALRGRIGATRELSVVDHFDGLDFSAPTLCPVCGSSRNPAVARFIDRSFFRCQACTMIYEVDFLGRRTEYGQRYFEEEYRAHYGKSYLEDFENIRAVSRGRLDCIAGCGIRLSGARLLDVGCAYGPFLAASADRGVAPAGLDVAAPAVDFVTTTLGFEARCMRFEDLDETGFRPNGSLDLLTMWYVIEHFPELDSVLKRVNRLLRMGGLFAFSTPNANGVSGRRTPARFLEKSPRDHFTIWTPRIARRVLARYGFRVRRIRVTGHHPERFSWGASARGAARALIDRYSRVCGLGDTFECYAVKVAEAER